MGVYFLGRILEKGSKLVPLCPLALARVSYGARYILLAQSPDFREANESGGTSSPVSPTQLFRTDITIEEVFRLMLYQRLLLSYHCHKSIVFEQKNFPELHCRYPQHNHFDDKPG